MITKVGLLGASGRMGLEVAALLREGFEHQGRIFELTDAVSSSKRFKSIEGTPVRTLSEPKFDSVHVWIDFSTPTATLQLLETINSPLVIGTTGFTSSQLEKIRRYSQEHPVFLAPNMSSGLNWILQALKNCPLPGLESYHTVLSETHHKNKKDAPSGTLKQIQQVLNEMGYPQPEIHATRAGEMLGVHEIRFISNDEEISITHRVSNRSVFARGALLAAVFLLNQEKAGLYSFEDFQSKERDPENGMV